MESYITTTDPKWNNSAGMVSMRFLISNQISLGSAAHVPEAVAAAAKDAGLVQVQLKLYNTNEHPELNETTRDWILGATVPLMKSVKTRLAGDAADPEAIEKDVQEHVRGIQESYKEGLVVHGAMGVVLAKVPEQ